MTVHRPSIEAKDLALVYPADGRTVTVAWLDDTGHPSPHSAAIELRAHQRP